jgi:hypothetical protein
MPGSCCAKPIAKIIKVGNSEAGIVGLEVALADVYELGIDNDEQIATALVLSARKIGNYISSGIEADYRSALLLEYREFVRKKKIGN